jgi:transposase
MRHLTGDSRHQSTLFPDTLDDYVEEDHPVRVIDAFVDTLDVSDLGFSKAETKATGRKPYHPADLLKLYIYGYLNQVRSSRRLEKECHRNLELLWLMKRLAPDFKTIADFRKDNGPAIRNTCQAFVRFCQQADLLSGRLVAIDGSKFKAAASKGQVITRKQLREQRRRVERLVDQYLRQLDEADQATGDVELERERVQQVLQQLKKEGLQLDTQAAAMDTNGSHQHCATEPDARLMRSGREGMVLGYNVQTAVDADSGLIVHHEVTQDGGDNRQLQPMAEAAREQLTAESLEVVADAGYSNGEQLAACEAQGITATVPSNRATNSQGDYFQKHEFTYDAQRDHYTCPAGEILHYKTYNTKGKMRLYTRTGCAGCALKPHCTSAENRWLSRHFHEAAFARSEVRLHNNPGLMRQRMAIVERPFAVLKQVLGLRRFLCWGLSGAKAEMGIGVLSYNLNRVIHQVGVKNLLVALK